MNIEELLKYVKRTNKYIDKDKLLEELSKSKYITIALLLSSQNVK